MSYQERMAWYEQEKRYILFGRRGMSSADVDKALRELRERWRV